MVSPVAHQIYDIAEYVRLEAYSNVRHEFLDGQIHAMAGGTPEATGLVTYPDVSVVCGRAERDARRVDVVRRLADGSWATFSARLGGSVTLESIESELRVDEVYRDPLTER